MGYQTGTSTGPNDLIDKLRLFLIDEGWSVNLFTTVGAGRRLHVQKSVGSGGPEMFFNFRSAINERGTTITEDNYDSASYGPVTGLCINGSTGYNVANSWDKQPGYPLNINYNNYSTAMVMTPMSTSAIPAYYFFAVGDSVHIVVEITAGKFQFMSFGCLAKEGLYPGGMYFSASLHSRQPYNEYNSSLSYGPFYFSASIGSFAKGAVYVNADSVADWRIAQGESTPEIWWPCTTPSPIDYYFYSQSGLASFFHQKSPNAYNNIAAMCPIYTLLQRPDGNYSLLGVPEGVRFLNVLNYSVGQEVIYGSETWKIFPGLSMATAPNSNVANCGFAFLKVV